MCCFGSTKMKTSLALICMTLVITLFMGVMSADEGVKRNDVGEFRLAVLPHRKDYVDYLKAIQVPEASREVMNNPRAIVHMTITINESGDEYSLGFVSKADIREVSSKVTFQVGKESAQTWLNDKECLLLAEQPELNVFKLTLKFPEYTAITVINLKHRYTIPVTHSVGETKAELTFSRIVNPS